MKGKTVDLEKERSTLLERDAKWAATASAGQDLDAILSYWTDDGVVIPPELPVVAGKAALRDYVEQSFRLPGFQITWSSDSVHFSPDGELAYLLGTNAVSFNGPDGNRIDSQGRVVTIWRKEADGEWRCCVDVWNAGPPA